MLDFHLRPTRREDATAVVEVINAYSTALQGEAEETLQTNLAGWDTPGLCLETDSVVAELPGGKLAATAELWDIQESHLRMNGYWRVHPDYQDQGIEGKLAEWLLVRARRNVPLALPGARVALLIRFTDHDPIAERVLGEFGFRVVRQLVRMEVELNGEDRPDESIIKGVRILSLDENLKEAAVRTFYEAFRDHWGMVPETYEQYSKRIMHMFDYPDTSLALSLVTMLGDEVVAAAICSGATPEDPRMGWVNLLGVRRAWRKRGIGETMLRHAFLGFKAHGLERAGLNVDAESLTGATRLYEKAGMHITRRYLTYELELRPGKDHTVRELQSD